MDLQAISLRFTPFTTTVEFENWSTTDTAVVTVGEKVIATFKVQIQSQCELSVTVMNIVCLPSAFGVGSNFMRKNIARGGR